MEQFIGKLVTASWLKPVNKFKDELCEYSGILMRMPNTQYQFVISDKGKQIFNFSYNDAMRKVIRIRAN